MPRAIWKGSISFGLVTIPVTLDPGARRSELKFHMLDGRDDAPVRYVRVNERTGEEVPWEDIVKGYEYEKDSYVIVTDDDFRAANVKATETVDIIDFVRAEEIDPRYFDTPYYLEPRKEGRKAYALLREALRKSGYVAIAKVVVKTRQHLAAIIVLGDLLLLEQLRYPYELRDPAELDLPSRNLQELGVVEKELEMAGQLVESMVGRWEPEKYKDTYRDDLLALIDKKAKVGEIEAPAAALAEERGGEVVDIMSLLKKSVEESDRGKKAPSRGRKRAAGAGGRRRGA